MHINNNSYLYFLVNILLFDLGYDIIKVLHKIE